VDTLLPDVEPGLQTATLLFTTALLSNTIAQTDLRETILLLSQNETTAPNLLSQLMNLINGAEIPISVRVEAWNTLSAIARHHFIVIQSSWPRFDTALAVEQDADDSRVRTAGLLFLGEFAKSGSGASPPLVCLPASLSPWIYRAYPCAAILIVNPIST
jgi:hypothetical protein